MFMNKDFDRWNMVKKNIDKKYKNKHVKSGKMYWCVLGINVGCEENGDELFYRRPVFVYSKIDYYRCLIIPITTSGRKYKNKKKLGLIKGRKNYLLLDQLRVIDTKRILDEVKVNNHKQSIKATKTVKDYLNSLRNSL
jgi:mRNA-degrading endonuclease toxin of MazEF toxin-antitoxin module